MVEMVPELAQGVSDGSSGTGMPGFGSHVTIGQDVAWVRRL